MKKAYSPEAIVRILQDVQPQLAAGASLRDLAKQIGINPGTLCRWQRRYGGMQIPEAKRMILLEKENTRLKQIVADLELDRSILKEALQGKY
jgi:transposase-like protein